MAVYSDLTKYFLFLSMPFHMSKSGIRQRDLPHPAVGSVTCSIAAVEKNIPWEQSACMSASECNKSHIKSVYFPPAASKAKLFGVCHIGIQS